MKISGILDTICWVIQTLNPIASFGEMELCMVCNLFERCKAIRSNLTAWRLWYLFVNLRIISSFVTLSTFNGE